MVNNTATKVITWRLLSILICVLMARLWFGDWHATWFGLFISILMTIIHYYFEKVWDYFKYPPQPLEWFER